MHLTSIEKYNVDGVFFILLVCYDLGIATN